MKVEDLRPKGACWQLRLHEKGGKQHEMPCHHALAEELRAYIDAAGIADDRKGYLFRTAPGHNATVLLEKPIAQADAWRMIRRRAIAAGIYAPIGNHSFPRDRHHGISRQWRRMRTPAQPSLRSPRRPGHVRSGREYSSLMPMRDQALRPARLQSGKGGIVFCDVLGLEIQMTMDE